MMRLGSCRFKIFNVEQTNQLIKPSEDATVVKDSIFVTITSFDPENCDPLDDALRDYV